MPCMVSGGVESEIFMAGHLLNATMANAMLPESRQRVADAAGGGHIWQGSSFRAAVRREVLVHAEYQQQQ